LGEGDVQFDAALVGDVAHHVPANPAASGVSPIGPRRERLNRGKRAVFNCVPVEAAWRERCGQFVLRRRGLSSPVSRKIEMSVDCGVATAPGS
jgi:hypothetical protein